MPVDAKWYVPKLHRMQCPHCQVLLLDTRHPRLPPRQIAFLVASTLLVQFGLPTRYARAGLAVLIFIFCVLYIRRRLWGVPDSQRYALDDT